MRVVPRRLGECRIRHRHTGNREPHTARAPRCRAGRTPHRSPQSPTVCPALRLLTMPLRTHVEYPAPTRLDPFCAGACASRSPSLSSACRPSSSPSSSTSSPSSSTPGSASERGSVSGSADGLHRGWGRGRGGGAAVCRTHNGAARRSFVARGGCWCGSLPPCRQRAVSGAAPHPSPLAPRPGSPSGPARGARSVIMCVRPKPRFVRSSRNL